MYWAFYRYAVLAGETVVGIVADPGTPKTRVKHEGFLKSPKKMGKIIPKNQNVGK